MIRRLVPCPRLVIDASRCDIRVSCTGHH
jgi:hypothetical protein